MGGLSMLLIERGPGLSTKSIGTSYSKAASTGYIGARACGVAPRKQLTPPPEFNDMLVPRENLLGGEGAGFMLAMHNFVHERWFIVAYILTASRGILSELLKWCHQRKVSRVPVRRARAQLTPSSRPSGGASSTNPWCGTASRRWPRAWRATRRGWSR